MAGPYVVIVGHCLTGLSKDYLTLQNVPVSDFTIQHLSKVTGQLTDLCLVEKEYLKGYGFITHQDINQLYTYKIEKFYCHILS